MDINGISPSIPAANTMGGPQGSGKDPQLSALEQKLNRLTNEKKQAVRNKDKDKERKLEQEIQAVKQQIAQLKQKEKQKEKQKTQEEAGKNAMSPEIPAHIQGLGGNVDQYA